MQALFADGPAGNTDPEHLWAWVDSVATVAPANVQLYTLARGYPFREIEPAAPQTLAAIHDWLSALGIASRAH